MLIYNNVLLLSIKKSLFTKLNKVDSHVCGLLLSFIILVYHLILLIICLPIIILLDIKLIIGNIIYSPSIINIDDIIIGEKLYNNNLVSQSCKFDIIANRIAVRLLLIKKNKNNRYLNNIKNMTTVIGKPLNSKDKIINNYNHYNYNSKNKIYDNIINFIFYNNKIYNIDIIV